MPPALKRLGDELAGDSPAAVGARDREIREERLDLAVAQHVREADNAIVVDGDNCGRARRGQRPMGAGRIFGKRRPAFGDADRDHAGQVGLGVLPVLHGTIVDARQ